jgi:hypothetical protein
MPRICWLGWDAFADIGLVGTVPPGARMPETTVLLPSDQLPITRFSGASRPAMWEKKAPGPGGAGGFLGQTTSKRWTAATRAANHVGRRSHLCNDLLPSWFLQLRIEPLSELHCRTASVESAAPQLSVRRELMPCASSLFRAGLGGLGEMLGDALAALDDLFPTGPDIVGRHSANIANRSVACRPANGISEADASPQRPLWSAVERSPQLPRWPRSSFDCAMGLPCSGVLLPCLLHAQLARSTLVPQRGGCH